MTNEIIVSKTWAGIALYVLAPLVVAFGLWAVTAIASNQTEVAVIKVEQSNAKEDLIEMKTDLKAVRALLEARK